MTVVEPTPVAAAKTFIGIYGTQHVEIERIDQLPIFLKRSFLSRGGFGTVEEVEFAGFILALKRTPIRRRGRSNVDMSEIKTLARLTERRATHVVSLVGSYLIARRPMHELGLLIWPVAPCDLAMFLKSLSNCIFASQHTSIDLVDKEDVLEDTRVLLSVTGLERKFGSIPELLFGSHDLIQECHLYLQRSLGCLTKGMANIHAENIRYGSVKPHNILLCTDGPYFCDFGHAENKMHTSADNLANENTYTPRWAPPEALHHLPRGRSEDVFSLGLIFLEIGQYLIKQRYYKVNSAFSSGNDQRPFRYAEHLPEIDQWLCKFIMASKDGDLETTMTTLSLRDASSVGRGQPESLRALAELIRQMLKHNPAERPNIMEIVDRLSEAPFTSHDALGGHSDFFGSCCIPEQSSSQGNDSHNVSQETNIQEDSSQEDEFWDCVSNVSV